MVQMYLPGGIFQRQYLHQWALGQEMALGQLQGSRRHLVPSAIQETSNISSDTSVSQYILAALLIVRFELLHKVVMCLRFGRGMTGIWAGWKALQLIAMRMHGIINDNHVCICDKTICQGFILSLIYSDLCGLRLLLPLVCLHQINTLWIHCGRFVFLEGIHRHCTTLQVQYGWFLLGFSECLQYVQICLDCATLFYESAILVERLKKTNSLHKLMAIRKLMAIMILKIFRADCPCWTRCGRALTTSLKNNHETSNKVVQCSAGVRQPNKPTFSASILSSFLLVGSSSLMPVVDFGRFPKLIFVNGPSYFPPVTPTICLMDNLVWVASIAGEELKIYWWGKSLLSLTMSDKLRVSSG